VPKCTKTRHFHTKIAKIFWGGAQAPSSGGDTLPHTSSLKCPHYNWILATPLREATTVNPSLKQ